MTTTTTTTTTNICIREWVGSNKGKTTTTTNIYLTVVATTISEGCGNSNNNNNNNNGRHLLVGTSIGGIYASNILMDQTIKVKMICKMQLFISLSLPSLTKKGSFLIFQVSMY